MNMELATGSVFLTFEVVVIIFVLIAIGTKAVSRLFRSSPKNLGGTA